MTSLLKLVLIKLLLLLFILLFETKSRKVFDEY